MLISEVSGQNLDRIPGSMMGASLRDINARYAGGVMTAMLDKLDQVLLESDV